jgi:hypothetical protein
MYAVASLTEKLKHQNSKHPGGHQLTEDPENEGTSRPAKGKPGLVKVKTGGLIHLQIPKVMKPITICDDSGSNKMQEQVLKQQPKEKQPVVKTDQHDEDKDDKDRKYDHMPYISREAVDGYIVSTLGHVEEYT